MNVKKRGYLSFLLGVVMMFAFAIPAFAADTGKLVINGQTYQSKGPHILLAVGNEDMESVVVESGTNSVTYNGDECRNGVSATIGDNGTGYRLYSETDANGVRNIKFTVTTDRQDDIYVTTKTVAASYKLFANSGFYGQGNNPGGSSTCVVEGDNFSNGAAVTGRQSITFIPDANQEIVKLNIRAYADGRDNLIDVNTGRQTVAGQTFDISRSDNKVTISFTMTKELYITALTQDETVKHNVTITTDANCTANPNGVLSVTNGESRQITFKPSTGNNVGDITITAGGRTGIINIQNSSVSVNGKNYTVSRAMDGAAVLTIPSVTEDVAISAAAASDTTCVVVNQAKNVRSKQVGQNFINNGSSFAITYSPDYNSDIRYVTAKTAKGTYRAEADDAYIVIEGVYYRMYHNTNGDLDIYLNTVPVNMEFSVNAKDYEHDILIKTDKGCEVDDNDFVVDDGKDVDVVIHPVKDRYSIRTLKINYDGEVYNVKVEDDKYIRVNGDRWYINEASNGDVTLKMVNVEDDVTISASTNYSSRENMYIKKNTDNHSNITYTGSNPFDSDDYTTVRVYADNRYVLTSIKFQIGSKSVTIKPFETNCKVDGINCTVTWKNSSECSVYFPYLTGDLTVTSKSTRGVAEDNNVVNPINPISPLPPISPVGPTLPNSPSNTASGVYHSAYMTGYGDGRFGASVNLTRAEAVSLLCRAIGETSGVAGSKYNVYFNDVPANAWYAESVNYAASRGYLSVLSQTGYSFNPNTPITRAEFIALLCKFKGVDVSSAGTIYGFSDVYSGHWLYKYISYAVNAGWARGTGNGMFQPDKPVTRAEICALVNNVLGRTPDPTYLAAAGQRFIDVPTTHWAYAAIIEASQAHNALTYGGTENWTVLR